MRNETVHQSHFDQLNTSTFLAVTLVIVQIGIFRCFCGVTKTPRKFLAGDRDSANIAICTSIVIQAAPHALLAVTWAFLPGLEIVHLASAFGVLIAGAITILLFTPIIYDMCENSISIYAYLEKRFNSSLPRRLVGMLHVAESCVMLAVHMCAPSLTISEVKLFRTHPLVSGFPVEVCIWLIILGTLATSVLSGNRGLLWTNFIQVILLLGVLLAVLLEANLAAGALRENTDTHVRSIVTKLDGWSFAASLAAWSAHWLLHFVSHQSFAQRTASAKSRTGARVSVGVSSIMIFFLITLGSVVGSSLKGAHARQHLLETHRADTSSDQVIYFFLKHAFGQIPGLPGLLIGMLFSAYIGCAASLCNAVTAVLFEDIVEPCLSSRITQKFRLNVARYLGLAPLLASSAVATATYFLKIPPSILLSLTGCVGGPIISFFTIGLLNSRSSLKASLYGTMAGLAVASVASWIFFEEGSKSMNHSKIFEIYEEAVEEGKGGEDHSTSLREWFQLWSASLVWVELLAFAVSVSITVIASFCTKSEKPANSDFECHVTSQTAVSDSVRRSRQQSEPAIDLTGFRGSTELKAPD